MQHINMGAFSKRLDDTKRQLFMFPVISESTVCVFAHHTIQGIVSLIKTDEEGEIVTINEEKRLSVEYTYEQSLISATGFSGLPFLQALKEDEKILLYQLLVVAGYIKWVKIGETFIIADGFKKFFV